ncbi:MAG: S-methyl-5'-thioinosine phosphorylase [Lachnospiraceae bacterium]|jgi:5'-methylthioadenosine phosphorylase|nr:S-methyl-5'-thioinosine phosphorylase [Lachnospiraceae bacterium]
MEQVKIGIIGGTGVYRLPGVQDLEKRSVATPYGKVTLNVGTLGGKRVAFLTRHGENHSISPGRINYRANIWAMKMAGVKQLVATACSGSLNPAFPAGSYVMLGQFIEFTKNRAASFYDTDGTNPIKIAHVDVTYPYCNRLGQVVVDAGAALGFKIHTGATYCCCEGPRFETAAEIKMLRLLGGDLVAQTNYPEVVLAREAEICYAAMGIVSNMAAGIADEHVSAVELTSVMKGLFDNVQAILAKTVEMMDERDECWCQTALAESFL